jgi:hypothetical protein
MATTKYLLFQFLFIKLQHLICLKSVIFTIIHTTTEKKIWTHNISDLYIQIYIFTILISRSHALQRMIKLLEILPVHSKIIFFLGCLCFQQYSCFTAETRYRKFEQIFPEKDLRGLSSNFHIHVSVSDLYVPTIGLPILLQENTWTDPRGIYNSLTETWMWKLGLRPRAIPFLGKNKWDFRCSVAVS